MRYADYIDRYPELDQVELRAHDLDAIAALADIPLLIQLSANVYRTARAAQAAAIDNSQWGGTYDMALLDMDRARVALIGCIRDANNR